MNRDVNLVKVEINRFLKSLYLRENEKVRCERVSRFFHTIDEDEKLEDFLTSLKFSEKLDNLRSVSATIRVLAKEIMESSSLRPTEKTANLRDSIIFAIQYLFKNLIVAPIRNSDLDYKLV